jgi:O-antigen ligase
VTATKKNKPAPGGRHEARTAAAASSGPDGSFWALDASWWLLLLALVATPLAFTNLSWLPGTHTMWLHAGSPELKALVMQALVGASLACFAVALFGRKVVVRWDRVAWLGAAFLAWSAVTTLTSVSPATAFIGYFANAEGFMALLMYTIAAFLTLQLADTPSRIRTMLRASSLTAAVVALYGLLQTFGADPLKWQPAQWGAFRSFSTVGNPDMFGAFMVLNLFVVLGLLLSETDRRWRITYAVATLVVGAAAFTSLARASWLGVVAGAVVFAVLAWRLKPRFTRVEAVMAAGLVVLVVGAGLLSLYNTDVDSNVVSRASAAFNSQDKNTLGRTETWRVAATAIAKRPVLGYGPDTFGLSFQPNKTEQFAALVAPSIVQANAHSSLIQLTVERGLPGAALWLALLVAVMAVSLPVILRGDDKTLGARVRLAGVVASVAGYFVASLLTPTSHESSLLLWCLLAVLLSPLAVRIARPVSRTVAVALVAMGLAATAVAGAFFVADSQAAIADDETVAPPARMAAADLAVRLDPLSAEYAAIAAKAYAQALPADGSQAATRASLFNQADDQMHRAAALEPTDPHRKSTLVGLLLLGGAELDKRYYKEAVGVAASAVRDAPNDLEAAYWYARALNAAGRPAEAVPVLERVLKIRPQYDDAVILLSDLYVARGDKAAARALLEKEIPLAVDAAVLRTRLERLGTAPAKP